MFMDGLTTAKSTKVSRAQLKNSFADGALPV